MDPSDEPRPAAGKARAARSRQGAAAREAPAPGVGGPEVGGPGAGGLGAGGLGTGGLGTGGLGTGGLHGPDAGKPGKVPGKQPGETPARAANPTPPAKVTPLAKAAKPAKATRPAAGTAKPRAPAARRSAVPPGETQRPDRRQDILQSAELLFAERGYAAVSVRDIAARAGVPVALVGYYFGRKPELFATVFQHRQANLDERIARIRQVGAKGPGKGRIEELVRAWAEPVVRMHGSASGSSFALLVARTAWDPGPEATAIIERFYDPLVAAFLDAMRLAMPGCPEDRLLWAYEYAVGALLMYVADKRIERLSGHRATAGDPAMFDDFVRFVAAGFHAMCHAMRR